MPLDVQIEASLRSYDAANKTVLLLDDASHSAVLMPLHILLSSDIPPTVH